MGGGASVPTASAPAVSVGAGSVAIPMLGGAPTYSYVSPYSRPETFSYTASFVSADRTLADSQSAPRRGGIRKAPGTIGGTLDNWIQGLDPNGDYLHGIEDGIWYFYEDKLRELYENAIANGDLPVGTTWEQFLTWFGKQDKYQFYNAPLPNGVGVLCVLALLYVVAVFVRNRKNVCRTESETCW